MSQKTAALKVPILPHTSPESSPPPLKLPLYPHQLRALHRCLLIENDGSLAKDFGATHDYKSRGGCLADAVGMGKTATSIGLILSAPRNRGEGDTLVVAPGHLIHQWKAEIEKFTDDIEVLVGKKEYERFATLPPVGKSHRVVLMNVDDVMNENKLWYNFRRVFSDEHGYQIRVDQQRMEEYKKAALFCVKSPRGPCSYEGYVYTGPLHLPFRPWRRVIFDEIQDLVAEGTESQKNLLQLSRTAKNVWLLSATPFPHGNMSVYANHELLGFCRLRMDVETDRALPSYHPFEVIKRKLYIRSPKHVADEAVTASQTVTSNTINIDATDLERKFFELEQNEIASRESFGEEYNSLRQMINHPEASRKLREQINGKDEDYRGGQKGKAVQQMNKAVGRFSTVNSFAKRSLDTARQRYCGLEKIDIPNAQKDIDLIRSSWHLALKIRQVRNSAVRSNPFANSDEGPPLCLEVEEAKAIHQYFCRCPSYGSSSCEADDKTLFQTIGRGGRGGTLPATIKGYKATQRVIDYFRNEVKAGRKIPAREGSNELHEYLDVFVTRKSSTHSMCTTNKEKLEEDKMALQVRITALEETVKVGGNTTKGMSEEEELAARNGSKMAGLITYLRKIQEKGEKTIVFSYWHDVLVFVQRSLRNNGLSSAFCNGKTGNQMAKSITSFTSGEVPILLLSAQAKASGANLQVASNVVLLDPAGSSAEHGATLEQQAIGRAVRMGQENAVKVVRFCVRDTVEEELFNSIDLAAAKLITRNNDDNYMCENAHKALDDGVLSEKKQAVDDEVCVGETVSANDIVARARAEAIRKGDVIEILDSDDEEEDSKPKAVPSLPVKTVPTTSFAKVKAEKAEPTAMVSTATKRANEEISESPKHPQKKARVSTQPDLTTNRASIIQAASTVSNDEETSSATSLTNDQTRKAAYLVDTEGKLHSVEEEKKRLVESQKEYAKLHDMELSDFNNRDRDFLDMLIELRKVKDVSGIAWVTGERCRLGKWCKYQRSLFRKNAKGVQTTLTEGRIKLLNDIDFPWGKEVTPIKHSTDDAQVAAGRVISPAEESSPAQVADKGQLDQVVAAEENSLKDLLAKCELEQYLDKFVAAGISSAGYLKEKLNDLSFMEKLVDNTGLKATEAIRLQIRASKQ